MRYNIKEYRKRADMTQQELSSRANVSRATISALENNRAQITTTGTLTRLADALGCKVSDFFVL